MDIMTVAMALGLAKRKVLPQVNSGDAGSMLVVNNEGAWVKGEPVTATISVSENTLSITSV